MTPTSIKPGSRVDEARQASLSPSAAKRLRDLSQSPGRSVSPSKRLDEIETLDIEKYFK